MADKPATADHLPDRQPHIRDADGGHSSPMRGGTNKTSFSASAPSTHALVPVVILGLDFRVGTTYRSRLRSWEALRELRGRREIGLLERPVLSRVLGPQFRQNAVS
jgi:hypothetical protein